MELKMKYQYTNFVYPYIVPENKYRKYIIKLLNNKNIKVKFFEKEKDIEIYNYFLPNIRKFMFNNFSFTKEKIEEFEKINPEIQATILTKYPCTIFEYNLKENIQGKVEEENGIFFKIDTIQIICFNTGICFEVIKTHIEESNSFEDVLNFNYKFKNINSKNNDNIKIQSNNFENMQNVTKLINNIINKSNFTQNSDIETQKLYTYTYTCIDQEDWNENKDFSEIENEFEKYANILPSNYNVRREKNKNYQISKLKYAKIGLTKTSTALLTSGIDVYNYTKLPYKFENQYFYTYIIELYKKIYLNKIILENKRENPKKTRKKFIEFSKTILIQEITNDSSGNELTKQWKEILEIETIFREIKNKFEIAYKELKIEKNEKINKIILIILIISLVINIINFWILFK